MSDSAVVSRPTQGYSKLSLLHPGICLSRKRWPSGETGAQHSSRSVDTTTDRAPRPTARSSRKAGGGTTWGSLLPAAGAAKAWLYLRVVALGSDHKAVTWAWGQGGKERLNLRLRLV